MNLEDKVYTDVIKPLFEKIRSDLYSQKNRRGNLSDDADKHTVLQQWAVLDGRLEEVIKDLYELEKWSTLLQETKKGE